MFVWGTNLVITDIQNRIRRFMRNYTPPDSSEALYATLIEQVIFLGKLAMLISHFCRQLQHFDCACRPSKMRMSTSILT